MKERRLVLAVCDIYYGKGTGAKVALLTSAQSRQQAPRGRYPSRPHGQPLEEAVKIHSHLEPGGRGAGNGGEGSARHRDVGTWPSEANVGLGLWEQGEGWQRVFGGDSVTACMVIVIPRAAVN